MSFGSLQAIGIPLAIPPLVVLRRREFIPPEPICEWSQVLARLRWVILKNRPLVLVGPAGFVQNFRRNVQLADIVEQGAPTQLLVVLGREAHLFGDHLGIRPHPLGVTPGHTIVHVYRGEQIDHASAQRRLVIELNAGLVQRSDRLLHLFHRPGAESGLVSGGRFVGEDEGDPHQCHKRQEPTGDPIDEQQHDRADCNGANPPHDEVDTETMWRQHSTEDTDRDKRSRNRDDENERPQQTRDDWAGCPRGIGALVVILRRAV